MIYFYLIGALIAFILGLRLIHKDKKRILRYNYDFLCPLAALSWISVVFILWKLRDKL